MAGIYIHIPFCKQACSYCDFHFSTNLKRKPDLLKAIGKEIELRSEELVSETIDTIYLGGGTPSLLNKREIERLFKTIHENYNLGSDIEYTLEANPDDLNYENIREMAHAGINRLSIGVQSFHDDDLHFMNRAHNSNDALRSIQISREAGIDDINVDLIYGFDQLSMEKWKANLDRVIDLDITHLSAYCLTIEKGTLLERRISQGKLKSPSEQIAIEHFKELMTWTKKVGWDQYEISNFCKPGHYSKHNTSYWKGKKYIGVGPSAHSFNGEVRRWNISNNSLYIKGILENAQRFEYEQLETADKFNEFVMTGLRTVWGIDLNDVQNKFGSEFLKELMKESDPHIANRLLNNVNGVISLTENGKLVADKIASDLFVTRK